MNARNCGSLRTKIIQKDKARSELNPSKFLDLSNYFLKLGVAGGARIVGVVQVPSFFDSVLHRECGMSAMRFHQSWVILFEIRNKMICVNCILDCVTYNSI